MLYYIFVDRKQKHKLDSKSDEGIFLEYFIDSREYRVFNNRTRFMIKSINIIVDDFQYETLSQEEGESMVPQQHVTQHVSDKDTIITLSTKDETSYVKKDSTPTNKEVIANMCFIFKSEPKNIKETLKDNTR